MSCFVSWRAAGPMLCSCLLALVPATHSSCPAKHYSLGWGNWWANEGGTVSNSPYSTSTSQSYYGGGGVWWTSTVDARIVTVKMYVESPSSYYGIMQLSILGGSSYNKQAEISSLQLNTFDFSDNTVVVHKGNLVYLSYSTTDSASFRYKTGNDDEIGYQIDYATEKCMSCLTCAPSQYQSMPCGANSDAVCTACAWLLCPLGEISMGCVRDIDTYCAPCTAVANMREWTGVGCNFTCTGGFTRSGDAYCAPCAPVANMLAWTGDMCNFTCPVGFNHTDNTCQPIPTTTLAPTTTTLAPTTTALPTTSPDGTNFTELVIPTPAPTDAPSFPVMGAAIGASLGGAMVTGGLIWRLGLLWK
jgi:hypothetical protein